MKLKAEDRKAEFIKRMKLIDDLEDNEVLESLNQKEYLLAVGRKSSIERKEDVPDPVAEQQK